MATVIDISHEVLRPGNFSKWKIFGNNVVQKILNKFVPLHAMKADGRVQLQIYTFLTPAPDVGGWSASGADKSTPTSQSHR